MGGVDRQDQFMACYPILRKTLWCNKKLGSAQLLLNSYFLYIKYVKKISFYDFRLSVLESLLPEDAVKNITKPKVSEHVITKIDKTNEKGKMPSLCQK